ncbi:Flavin-dependent oxidoreductase, luciferase family (includes alkanesulfonate monooxygenase SsuD and methylene tetrahydromethanopterin reductase) [Agrococcus baldri]|uniref:Flavin-dependent oxidoreductase, luciferase family (Includes alkanesulfonate monooxygenase SsuD and methylene tetrahydromethanopterin reductase) n=1 Tax=Agrococcus baldri TaxID=153730 RepID=A0AA94KZJ5_9MICO|nr:LLM class flavin-dependent oxidoreductase [Agrococcus baldri]SFS09551.1 Flavin-dependent oxidoreductase, luciferase family (includes alkanesulfonate monooxygenase SsuD and methylene tetrahydromethanopterin reductase) [Agrococcus baldri]
MRKRIGFLSFGHYRDVPGSRVPTAGDSLRMHVDLAVAAEEAGLDGAWVRVHHFDQSLATPYPLLAAMGARTSTLELGTGVIDLRYEQPLAMTEIASATDLITGGRLQLGISRGSPERAADGQERFGLPLPDGANWSDLARDRAAHVRRALRGEPQARSARAMQLGQRPDLPVEPRSPGLADRLWWGAGNHASGLWAAEHGYHLLSSTLLLQDDGRPFHVQQAEQVRAYRDAYAAAGHALEPRTAVTRSAFPIVNDDDRRYFGLADEQRDGVGHLDGGAARSGPTYAGEPEHVARRLLADEAVQEADTVLFALPSQLGYDYNAHLLASLGALAGALGWRD